MMTDEQVDEAIRAAWRGVLFVIHEYLHLTGRTHPAFVSVEPTCQGAR